MVFRRIVQEPISWDLAEIIGGDAVDVLPNELPTTSPEILYKDLNDVLEKQAEPRYYMAQGYFDTLVKHKKRNEQNGNGFGYRIVNDESIENPIANRDHPNNWDGLPRICFWPVA